MTDEAKLIERLRDRAEYEREIQRNNQAVADALASQMEAFERRDGTHNTFAFRLGYEHKKCAENDAKLAADWDEAAARLTALTEENERLQEALRPFAEVAEHDIGADEADCDAFRPMFGVNRAPYLTVGHMRRARAALSGDHQPRS